MRARVPTISRWLSSSVPMSIRRSLRPDLAIEALDRILHRGRKLAVGAAELFEKHIAEAGIRLVDADRIHELFDVMIHGTPAGMRRPAHPADSGSITCRALCSLRRHPMRGKAVDYRLDGLKKTRGHDSPPACPTLAGRSETDARDSTRSSRGICSR